MSTSIPVDILEGLIFESNVNPNGENNQERKIELPQQRRCVSHLLNLVSNDFERILNPTAKSALISAINKLHAQWVFTHRSSNAKSICKEVLGCILKIPCMTRWNSKFDAISHTCRNDIEPKINTLIRRLSIETKASHLSMLIPSDWAISHEYIKVMKPIAVSLDRLQGDKTASQGYIAPTLRAMKFHIAALEGPTLLTMFKKAALDVIQKRFARYLEISHQSKDIILAAVSLPIFKTNFIENPLDERRVRDMLREECLVQSNGEEVAPSVAESNIDLNAQDDFFICCSHNDTQRRNSIESNLNSEIARYCCDERKEMRILNEYPNIRKIYYRYNTTLSSSGAIERTFSFAKMIFRPHRNRITAENFERTLLLKLNHSLIHDEVR